MTRAREAADSDLGALPPALRRRRAGAHRRLALSERGAGAPDRRIWAPSDDDLSRRWICTPSATTCGRPRKRNTFTGKTYNSLDNISQFFGERGHAVSKPVATGSAAARTRRRSGKPLPTALRPPRRPRKRRAPGQTVEHPKYGTGVVVRREGEGDDAKITVNFPGYGFKKLIEKYAGLKRN